MEPLIAALHDSACYDHPVAAIEVLETHISWVVLAGEFAYKLKKPVDFGFLDFTTRERRRFYCEEELRLNRRLAPTLYLAVVPLTGSPAAPQVNGSGEPFDYAVKMRRFEQAALLSRLAERGELQDAPIDALAAQIGRFHAGLPGVPPADYGSIAQVSRWTEQNFTQIKPLLCDPVQRARLAELHTWTEAEQARRHDLLAARREQGFIREGHGDLHLGNIVLFEGQVTPFDAIEFNPELRWIDVQSEAAFLMMDLIDRRQRGLAFRWLDQYLQYTGDYAGLPLLRYYGVYRALVRAKVALLQQAFDVAADYLALAHSFTQAGPPLLILLHGLSGSGKSTVAAHLVEALGAVRMRSDVERKRLFGLTPEQASAAALHEGIYTQAAGEQTYARLQTLAAQALPAGFPVIVDAAFLQQAQRDLLRALAVPTIILDCQAPPDVLAERVSRQRPVTDAGPDVLAAQIQTHEPLTEAERAYTLAVDTTQPLTGLTETIRRLL